MREISAALLGLMLFAPYEGTERPWSVAGRIDVTAILRSWRLKGVLVCTHRGHARACLWVENAYPCGLFEVVRRPFTSHLAEAQAALRTFAALQAGLSSSGGAERAQTNLQFADARVFTFIPALPEGLSIPIAAPRGPSFQINYVSEFDAAAWRTGWPDRLLYAARVRLRCEVMPDPAHCAGRWGGYYPREGFLVHQSEPMASLLQALRAGRVASDPAGRLVLRPYAFEPRTGHFIQFVRPVLRPAVRIGGSAAVDAGAGSLPGAYLFVHLAIFEGCHRCLPTRLVGPRAAP